MVVLIPRPHKTQFSTPDADSISAEVQQLTVHPPAHRASPQSQTQSPQYVSQSMQIETG